jgi:hypothetical protein
VVSCATAATSALAICRTTRTSKWRPPAT